MNEKPTSFFAPLGAHALRESQSARPAPGRPGAARAEAKAERAEAGGVEDEETRALIESMAGGKIDGGIRALNG